MRKGTLIVAVAPVLLAGLAACNNDSEVPDTQIINAPAGENAIAGGYFEGTFQPSDGRAYQAWALITEGGEAAILADNNAYAGAMSVDGIAMDAKVTVYESTQRHWTPGTVQTDGSLEGFVSERDFIEGDYAFGDATGTFALYYDASVYEQASDAAMLQGTWGISDERGNSFSVTFRSDGSFYGQNTSGCVFSGSYEVPEQAHNLYKLDPAEFACGLTSHSLKGAGFIHMDEATQVRHFRFAAYGDNLIIHDDLSEL